MNTIPIVIQRTKFIQHIMQLLILLLSNSKNFVIMMYNGGAKLKVNVVRQAESHLTAFYASYTSRLNLPLEDLSANLNVCIRYGFTSNPKPLKMQLKCINTIMIVMELNIVILILINYRDISQYRYYHSALGYSPIC